MFYRKTFSLMLCILLSFSLVSAGCAHPWRIANNPNSTTEDPGLVSNEPEISAGEPTEPVLISADLPTLDPWGNGDSSPDPFMETPDNSGSEPTAVPCEQTISAQPVETINPVSSSPNATKPAATNTPVATSTPKPVVNPTSTPSPKPTQTPTPKPTAKPTPTPAPAPASDIPPFSSKAINAGQGTYDNSFLSKNKITMVNVWSTTCGPCIQEMPHFPQLENRYGSKGFKILSVLGDSETPGSIPTAIGIINGMNFNIPVIRNNSSVATAFPAAAYPMTYFIDSYGRILKRVPAAKSFDEWCQIIDTLLQ